MPPEHEPRGATPRWSPTRPHTVKTPSKVLCDKNIDFSSSHDGRERRQRDPFFRSRPTSIGELRVGQKSRAKTPDPGAVTGCEQCGKQKIHLNNPGYKSQPKSLKSTFLIEHSISFVEHIINSQNVYALYILLRRLVSLVQDVGLSKDGGNCEWG